MASDSGPSRLRWSFTSRRKRDKLLKAACDRLRLWPETSALLDLAAEKGVAIAFDDALLGSETEGMVMRNRKTGKCRIALKPSLVPEDIAIPLIHELRHLWQEETLGLKTGEAARAEKDALTALFIMRVKEADAFAFTSLMIARLNHAQEDFIAARGMKDEEADEFLAARILSRLPGEREAMARDFEKALSWLDSYDAETLSEYHRRYTAPLGAARHAEKPLGTPAVRRLLKTGTFPDMPPYLDALDDAALEKKVMAGVRPELKEAAQLMTAFEKAAARGLGDGEDRRQRAEIARQLRDALKTKSP
jgi:hypothetical protein